MSSFTQKGTVHTTSCAGSQESCSLHPVPQGKSKVKMQRREKVGRARKAEKTLFHTPLRESGCCLWWRDSNGFVLRGVLLQRCL